MQRLGRVTAGRVVGPRALECSHPDLGELLDLSACQFPCLCAGLVVLTPQEYSSIPHLLELTTLCQVLSLVFTLEVDW